MVDPTLPSELVKELLLSLQSAGIEYLPFRGKVPVAVPRPVRTMESFIPRLPDLPKAPAIVAPPPPKVVTPVRPTPPILTPAKIATAAKAKPIVQPKPVGRLGLLQDEVEQCTRCPSLASTRLKPLFGFGPERPAIMFIGEAPTAEEDRQGNLFVGEVGDLFDRILTACGLTREQIYLTNLLKCRIPGKREAKEDECHNCRPYLEEQIALIAPKVICCLGQPSSRKLLGSTASLTELRQTPQEYKGIPVFCTHHPMALLAVPDLKRPVWEDLKRVLEAISKLERR